MAVNPYFPPQMKPPTVAGTPQPGTLPPVVPGTVGTPPGGGLQGALVAGGSQQLPPIMPNGYAGIDLGAGMAPTSGSPNPPYTGPGFNGGSPQAVISPDILNSMKGYTDAAYAQSQRTLDPQWQQNSAAFQQRMLGQGLQPGSQAYDNAMRDFSASQNDAYASARNNAMQQGLNAQGQAFNQGLGNATLANNYDIAGIQAAAQRAAASTSAHASMFGATTGANASMSNNANDNATSQLLGLGNLGLGYNGQQMQGNQNDFQNMLAMLGLGNGMDMSNNGMIGGAAGNLMGQIPGGNPNPIDVTGAYGMQQQGLNNQYNAQAANASATNQTEGQAASAALTIAIMM